MHDLGIDRIEIPTSYGGKILTKGKNLLSNTVSLIDWKRSLKVVQKANDIYSIVPLEGVLLSKLTTTEGKYLHETKDYWLVMSETEIFCIVTTWNQHFFNGLRLIKLEEIPDNVLMEIALRSRRAS